jgi:antitoxin ParD1/3/4
MALHGLPEGFGVAFGAERLKGYGAAAQGDGGEGWDGLPVEGRGVGFRHRNRLTVDCLDDYRRNHSRMDGSPGWAQAYGWRGSGTRGENQQCLAKLANLPILALRCPMPTRNVSLTRELDQFVASRVETGLYANASEVMRTALRLLEKEEQEYEQKMAVLRAAIAEGDNSADAEEGVFERLYAYIDELANRKEESIGKVQCL